MPSERHRSSVAGLASMKQGLQEAIAHQQGRQAGVKLHVPPQVDVKEVRRRTGLTQAEFAAKFAISLGNNLLPGVL